MRRVWIAAVLAPLLAATAAAAPTKLEEAKTYFDAGKQAYEARQYLAAALAFEQAYELSDNAAVLFSTAQAFRLHYLLERDVSSLDRAIDLYRRYLVEVSGGSRRADAAEHLASLELQLAQLTPERRAGAPEDERPTQIMVASRIDGAQAWLDDDGPRPVPLVRAVAPGPHRVRVERDGYFPETLSVVAVEGRLVVAQVDLRPQPARLNVAAPAGAKIALDGRALGEAPLGSVQIEAGQRLVTVQARGKTGFAKQVTLERGAETYVPVELEDTGQRTFSYVVLGTAAATFTAAMVTGSLALINEAAARGYLLQKDVLQQEDLTGTDLSDYRIHRARRSRYAKSFYGTLIASAALGAAGAALYFLDEPGGAVPSLAVTPVLGPGTAGLASTLRF